MSCLSRKYSTPHPPPKGGSGNHRRRPHVARMVLCDSLNPTSRVRCSRLARTMVFTLRRDVAAGLALGSSPDGGADCGSTLLLLLLHCTAPFALSVLSHMSAPPDPRCTCGFCLTLPSFVTPPAISCLSRHTLHAHYCSSRLLFSSSNPLYLAPLTMACISAA